jgi:hypothetical protein
MPVTGHAAAEFRGFADGELVAARRVQVEPVRV